jgi:hypothetical protein
MAKRSKKKTKAKKARKPRGERQPIDWGKVFSRTTSAVIVLLFVGGGVAWAWGAQSLRDYVGELQEAEHEPLTLRLNWPLAHVVPAEGEGEPRAVPYVGEERAERIRRDLRALVRDDPFDERSLAAVGYYLQGQGWLKEEGARIRRRPGNVIEISGDWRQPRYAVRHSGYDYVVGADFGLLPLREVAGSPIFAEAGLRFIEGVYAGVPRNPLGEVAPGSIWPGTELRAAATLLELLKREAGVWSQVAGVRVEPGEGTALHQLLIITDHGSQILWGRPPGEEGPIEHPATYKLGVLARALDGTRRIDMGHAFIDIRTGDYEIDLTSGAEGD